MVRTYKRKTNRQQWNENNMLQAVQAILKDKMGFQRASDIYHIPRSTLERRVRFVRSDPKFDPAKKTLGRFKTVFNAEQEEQLVEYVKSMQARLFGLTSLELRSLAFQLAKRNNLENNFNEESELAGKDWLRKFLQRHSDLSCKRLEPTSVLRATGFNKVAVNHFFDLLETTIDKYKFTEEDIYNVHETCISVVPKFRSKIIATKGRKQVGCLPSAERGKTITIELCFSASGMYMPPLFIFPRMRLKPELLDGAPPGAWGECSVNGWINSKIFFTWFKMFVDFSRAVKGKPKLLLLDGHSSHVKNLEVIDYAQEHGVILLSFPPHCTHKLQPLDVAFMKPINTLYNSKVKKWLKNHPGRVVSQCQIVKLFGDAFLQSATMLTAINGFQKCGIWPFNRDIFTDIDFIAAKTTNTETLNNTLEQYSISDDDIIITSTKKSQPSTSKENIEEACINTKPAESGFVLQNVSNLEVIVEPQSSTCKEHPEYSRHSTSTQQSLPFGDPQNVTRNASANFAIVQTLL